MWIEDSALKRFCLVDSSDYGQVRNAVSLHLRPHRMSIDRQQAFRARLYGVSFGHCALFDLNYGTSVEIEVDDIHDYYLLRLTLQGTGQVSQGKDIAALHKGSITVSSPSQRCVIRSDHNCRSLLLRVERAALEYHLQSLLGRTLSKPLVFEVGTDSRNQGLEVVRATVEHICSLHQHSLNSEMQEGMSAYVISVLLTRLPHNYSALINLDHRSSVPRHVRLARDYMEAHLHEALTLTLIAEHCGVSVRTLQHGFARYLDQTPLEYMRCRRLARIHQALKSAGKGASVTDILLEHGVSSIGHFATHYRKAYGCLPSATLRRSA